MASTKNLILTALLLSVIFGAVFYFKDSLVALYQTTAKNLQQFDREDLGNVLNEIKKDILSPPPLNLGGIANEAVLTKAGIIAQTNLARKNNGNLLPLVENAKLTAAARAKAQDMLDHQYFEHISPDGIDPGELVAGFGYEYVVTGENLILGNFKDEAEVLQAWMDSPGHRANILHPRFTQIGVAMVKGAYKGKTVWIGVQEFGLPLSTCQQPSVSLKNTIVANKQALDALALEISAKRQEIERTNRNSGRYNQLVDEYNQLVAQYNTLNEQTKTLISQYNGEVNTFNACVGGS